MQDDETKQIGLEDFRLRAPQNDFGEVISDNMVVENLYLFDDKEFYVHVNQPEKLVLY